MDEKNMWGFSWPTMFIVTACSLVGFSFILKMLDGDHSPLLLKIGGISFGLALLSWIITGLNKMHAKKKSSLHP